MFFSCSLWAILSCTNTSPKVKEENSNLVQKYLDSGLLEFQRYNYIEAVKYFDSGIRIDSLYSPLYSGRGDAKAYSGDLEGALVDFNKAVDLSPNKIKVFIARGNLKILLKDYEGVISDYSKCIELEPFSSSFYCTRGGAKLFLQKYSSAIQDLNKAVELNPENAEAYFIRGKVNIALKQKKLACMDFQKCVDLGITVAMTELSENCQ